MIIYTHLSAIKQVLSHQQTDKLDTDKATQNPHFKKILGDSLILQSGKKATNTRNIMNPAFKHKKLQTLIPLFFETAHEMTRFVIFQSIGI